MGLKVFFITADGACKYERIIYLQNVQPFCTFFHYPLHLKTARNCFAHLQKTIMVSFNIWLLKIYGWLLSEWLALPKHVQSISLNRISGSKQSQGFEKHFHLNENVYFLNLSEIERIYISNYRDVIILYQNTLCSYF